MMEQKRISTGTITYNDEQSIDMMLDSCLEFADEIVIVDGGSTDLTVPIIKQYQEKHPNRIKLIIGPEVNPEAYSEKYVAKDKVGRILQNGHFGMMRTIVYANLTGDWVFWIDADECLKEDSRIQLHEIMNNQQGITLVHVSYLHFVHDFNHIDNSQPFHTGLYRFHKIVKDITFPRYNHALPTGNFKGLEGNSSNIIIWHLGYARNLFDIYERYKRNMNKSEMHSGMQQCFWRDWHYYNYPKRELKINPNDFPLAIKNRFEINQYYQSNN